MAGRYTYSPYEVDQYPYDQMGGMQSGPRRFFSAVGRFFYRLVVLTLIVGALGGVLFALYRNDVLLNIARGAGLEGQYKSMEARFGGPGWGTPRSIDLPKDLPTTAAVAPASDSREGASETVHAAADSPTTDAKTSEAKTSTPDGVAIVSFDSLPTAGKKTAAAKEPEAVSLNALPAAPARNARAEPARAEPAPPRQRAAKAKPAEPKTVEVTRSIPLPKPKPEPVAKAEPAPKPEPPAPKPAPEEDHTKARASDNPLKAAIRASMAGKKTE